MEKIELDQTSKTMSEKEQEELISSLADKVIGSRLSVPALLFLEMHLPVTTIAHTSVLFLQPLLSPLFGADRVQSWSELLSERKNIELLIETIRKKEEEGGA